MKQSISLTIVFFICSLAASAHGEFWHLPAEGSIPNSSLAFVKDDQTITFTSLNAKTYGDASFELEATASSGLPVTYTSSDEDIATISGSTVTMHKTGTVIITAQQEGNAAYNPAESVEQSLAINPRFVNETSNITPGVPHGQYFVQEWADYDNDGDLDLLIGGYALSTASAHHTPPFYLALWRNGTTGSVGPLTEVTESVGLNIGLFRGNFHFGDYDNDGDLDILLVGTDGSYQNVTKIWRNDVGTDGVFVDVTETVAPGVPQTGGGSSARWGDFDGDGDLDFALTGSSNSGTITQVWRNGTTGTSGTFSLYANFAPLREAAIEWVDYDNDGDLDLSATGLGNTYEFHLYRNGTTGTRGDFTSQTANMLSGIQGTSYPSINWKDIDSDGDADLLLTGNYSDGNITSLWINGTNGTTGIFTDQTVTVASGIDHVHGIVPAWGDYDSDGDLDLFFAGAGNQGTLYLQVWNNSNGIFTRTTTEEPTDAPRVSYGAINLIDYDNDGDLDLFTTGGSGSTQFWENTGPVENTPPTVPDNLTATSTTGGNAQLTWAASTDDLTAVASITYNVRVGTTSGGIDVVSPHTLANGMRTIVAEGNASRNETFYLTSLASGTYYWSVQSLDNGYASSAFSVEHSFIVKADQLLEGEDTVRATYGGESFALEFTSNTTNEISYISSNHDVATIENGEVLVHNAGIAIITASQEEDNDYYEGTTSQVVVVSPVLLTITANAASKMKGTTDPTFTYAITNGALVGDDALEGALERAEGEEFGDYDIEIGSLSSDNYEITFVSSVLTIHPRFVNKTSEMASAIPSVDWSDFDWGDYDNDGDLDVVITGSSYPGLPYYPAPKYTALWRNGTTGTTGVLTDLTEEVGLNAHTSGGQVEFGDFDNDGDLDILITGSGSGSSILQIWKNEISEEGKFTNVTEAIAPNLLPADQSSIAWGDYDGDGDLDFAFSGNTNQGQVTQVWRNGETGTLGIFTNQTSTIAPEIVNMRISSMAWVDYDKDGDLDLSVSGYGSSTFQLQRNGSTGSRGIFTNQTDSIAPGIIGTYYGSVSWKDIDSDGDDDILLNGINGMTQSGNLTSIWINGSNGSLGLFTEQLATVAPGMDQFHGMEPGWGDYDMDGDNDLLVAGYNSNGAMVVQFWNNTDGILSNNTNEEADGLPRVSYGKIQLLDYDRDGDLDMFTLGSNGGTSYWENTDLTINAAPSIPDELASAATAGGNVALSWASSTDDTTPSITLSYNVKVGAASGAINILSPHVFADGTRTVVREGNASKNLNLSLAGLAPGTYYWSVQSLDNGYAASEFSSENTFTVKTDQLLESDDTVRATYGDESFALEFISNTANEISYTSSNHTVATIENGEIIVHNAGIAIITASQEEDNDYYEGIASQVLVVESATLTIAATESSKIYGEEVPSLSYTASGFVNDDDESLLTGTLTTSVTEASPVGNYSIEQGTLTANDNYTINYTAAAVLVTSAPLTVTADDKSKVYGESVPELTYTVSGFVNGDDEAILSGALSATGYTVGEFVIEQGDLIANNNYTVNYTSAMLEVTAATLSIGAYYEDIEYGNEIPVFTFYASGFVGGDSQSILSGALSTTATATSGAGTYTIEQGTLTAGDNYIIDYTPEDFVIHKASLHVTADSKNMVYGDEIPALTYTVSGFVHDDTENVVTGELAVSASSVSSVGEYYIVRGTIASQNYNVSYVGNSLTISKATLTVTADNKSKVYGDNNPTLTISYSGFVGQDSPSDIIAPDVSVEANEFSYVGDYAIELKEGFSTNYDFDFVEGTLQIGKKVLSLAADNKSKVYGEENPDLTLVANGFVNEDDVNNITLPQLSTTATLDSDAGEYAIQLMGGSATNYELQLTNGTLTITKADQTITFVQVATKTIGGASFELEATASSNLGLTFTSESGHTEISDISVNILSAGSETITATQAGNQNYTAATASVTFCINPSKPIITSDFTNAEGPVLTSSNAVGNQWYINNELIATANQVAYAVLEPGSYSVISTVDGCASVSSDAVSIIITGMETASSNHTLQVYPNPATDKLEILFKEAGEKQLKIIHLNGSVMHQTSVIGDRTVVRVADYAAGVYLIKVTTANTTYTARFHKN